MQRFINGQPAPITGSKTVSDVYRPGATSTGPRTVSDVNRNLGPIKGPFSILENMPGGNASLYDAGSVSNAARSVGPRSPGVNQSLQDMLLGRKQFNRTDGNGVTRMQTQAGGVRYTAGTQMNMLPPTSFGAANPGIASNNLAMAKARGGSSMQMGNLPGGGSRTLLPDGRVSVVGRPLQGYPSPSRSVGGGQQAGGDRMVLQKSPSSGGQPMPGYEYASTTPQQRAAMGLPPRGSTVPRVSDPARFAAARASRKERLQQARQMQFMNARFDAAKTGRAPMVDSDGNVDLLATLGINFANRPGGMDMAGELMGMREQSGVERERNSGLLALNQQQLAAEQFNADRQFGLARRESREDIADRREARQRNAALMPFEEDQRRILIERGELENDQLRREVGADTGLDEQMLVAGQAALLRQPLDDGSLGQDYVDTVKAAMSTTDPARALQDNGLNARDIRTIQEAEFGKVQRPHEFRSLDADGEADLRKMLDLRIMLGDKQAEEELARLDSAKSMAAAPRDPFAGFPAAGRFRP